MESWVFQNWDGQLRYRGALLADGWNTQSLEHFRERVDDGVLSTALDNDPIDVIIDLVGTLEPSFSNLEFSWVGTDPIPDSDVECLSGAESAFGLCLFE